VNGLETSVSYYERNPIRYKEERKETEDRREIRPNLDPDITPYTPPIFTIRSAQSFNQPQLNSNKTEHDKRTLLA